MNAVIWQFATSDDFTGSLIRWGTRSGWSHVDAVMPDGSLLGALLDGGVQIRPPDYYDFPHTMRVSVETDCADNFYEILQTQIGKPYDWRAIVSFVFGDREWQNADSWFCSELQIWAMEQAGFFEKSLMIDANKLSPRDQLLLFSPWLSLVHLNDTVPHNKAIRLSPF